LKTHPFQTAKLALLLLPLLLSFGTKGAVAQITSAPDGTGTIVQHTGQNIDISGGTQVGRNQFHSFQQFGVNAGQAATFLSNPNTANIVGRVIGGDPSFINGLLRVTGSNANLYLMNPAGIVFGKGASLNIPAAFTATTANSIGFGNGQWFNAFGPNNYATLTGNPSSFGFVGASGALINAGNLAVNPGQQISLIGGTVINTGTIEAPGGTITVAAVPGQKLVRIGQAGTVLSLDLPTSDKTLINAAAATPLSLPELLTGGNIPPAMGVVVEDGVVKLTGGSAAISGTLSADGVGSQNGGNVVAYADNRLDFSGTISAKGGELGGNGGFVETSGKGLINIDPNAKVVTTALKGEMGNWVIDPANLEVVAGTGGTISAGTNDPNVSTIGADTIIAALDGTNVTLQADNSITVNAAIDASSNFFGGDLSLNSQTANLNQAITLRSGSILSGTATTVNVGANGTVQNGVDVAAAGGTVNLSPVTYTLSSTVNIGKNLTVQGAGANNTKVSGNNTVGVFNITGNGNTTFDSLRIINGNTGGFGGGISNTGNGVLTVTNSTVSGNRAVFGGGIFSQNFLTLINSTLSGNTATDVGGGGIGINAFAGAVTVTNSTLSSNTASGSFGGGGILSGGTVTLVNSTVSGNTANTDGGGIVGYSGGTITNSTITNNTTDADNNGTGNGGGIYRTNRGTFAISNSIIAGNFDLGGLTPDLGSNVAGEGFANSGNNLIGANDGFTVTFPTSTLVGTIANPIAPKLAPLGNYGGPTQTHALLPGSVAIDAGDPAIITSDQRGVAPVGTRDIGAYESKGFALLASNNNQSTTVNTAFANPLIVNFVETAFNSPLPVAGIEIQLSTPSSGASATLDKTSGTTDSTGAVTFQATANTKAGSYTVQANSAGFTGTNFSLTNLADIANAITANSGPGQSTTVNTQFANPFVATVTDQYGNPVANSTVTLTVPSSGAGGIFSNGSHTITLTSDINGIISTALSANNTPGTYTGTVQISDTELLQFTLTNSPVPAPETAPAKPEIVLPFNLQAKDTPNSSPSLSPTGSVLCIAREGDQSVTDKGQSQTDPYKGVATCGAQSGK
jgi:filamentous hemagglutinin family protein